MSPASIMRRSEVTPREWRFVCLVDCIDSHRGGLEPLYAVRHATTFNRIDAGLRLLAKIGKAETEEALLPQALAAGAQLEAWLAANDQRK